MPCPEVSLIKIETYWNVNARYFQAYQFSYLIKIETYWNVNNKT